MRMKLLLGAAVMTVASVPAMAQTDGAVVVTATTTARPAMMDVTNVDVSRARDLMDDLRDYLTRMQENSDLAWSTSDFVHMDAYRRTNAGLLSNASALAMNIKDEFGPATKIPGGLGATRDYIDQVANHLHHARMMADYSTPIDHAKTALENAYEAMDRSNIAMSGSNMGTMGTTTTVTTDSMDTTTSGTTVTPGTTGTTGTTDPERITEPGMNMSNPGLQNYNMQNDAATGVGATTSTPNTTPGQPGTGNTDTDPDVVTGDMD